MGRSAQLHGPKGLLCRAVAGLLLINPHAGGGDADVEGLVEEAHRRGIDARVLGEQDDVGAVARAAGADVLGVAGGDGSLAPVAAAAIDRDVPFVCVPSGTRNHFAGDLGLDRRDPLAALAAFVRVDGDELPARVLLVGNNRYDLDLFTLGARPRLDEGELSLYAADGWLPLRWTTRSAPRFRVELDAPDVEVAADGEPLVLEPPLEFEILPRALRVLVPPER